MNRTSLVILVCAILVAVLVPTAQANYFIYPYWVPIYQGVEYCTGSSGGATIYAVKVDLQNPYVQLYASHDNGTAANEVTTETGAVFNSNHGCQVCVNASYCDPTATGDPAKNVDVWGLAISDGMLVSPGYTSSWSAIRLPTSIYGRQGSQHTRGTWYTPTGIYTAVDGNAHHLVAGYPLGATTGPTQRTSFGYSQDGRYLFMACCSYATIYNMSCWMLDLGAYEAINMDGGGSSCMTRADVGKVFPSGTERRVGIHLGVRAPTLTPPPYEFASSEQGFYPGNNASAVGWAGPEWGWPGVMFFDQTGSDCWVYSPYFQLAGGTTPKCVQVSLYEQNGNTSSHDMQAFWKTNNYNYFAADKCSPAVNFTAQNSWTAVNLNVENGLWSNQTINQLRLDFDNASTATRHIVNHVIVQDQLRYTFDTSVQQWFAGNSLTTPFWWSADGFPGMLVTDQIGGDAFMYSPLIGGAYNYLGGSNDRVHVRLFPVGGSPNHDMQVFWIQDGNQTWDAAKSSSVVTYTGNSQWCDVYIPVGQNSLWGQWGQIQEIRLDLDNGNNTGCRYHIDYIKMEY